MAINPPGGQNDLPAVDGNPVPDRMLAQAKDGFVLPGGPNIGDPFNLFPPAVPEVISEVEFIVLDKFKRRVIPDADLVGIQRNPVVSLEYAGTNLRSESTSVDRFGRATVRFAYDSRRTIRGTAAAKGYFFGRATPQYISTSADGKTRKYKCYILLEKIPGGVIDSGKSVLPPIDPTLEGVGGGFR